MLAIFNLPVFHSCFCNLDCKPSIKISKAAVPVIGSQFFILRNALHWIENQAVFIEIRQIKM